MVVVEGKLQRQTENMGFGNDLNNDGRLVGCIEGLRHSSGIILVILRLGSRRQTISEILATRPGIEPRASCSASQEYKTV